MALFEKCLAIGLAAILALHPVSIPSVQPPTAGVGEVTATAEARYSSNRISWEAAPGATGYMVSASEQENGPFTPLMENVLGSDVLEYVDSTAGAGVKRYYRVTAYTASGEKESAAVSDAIPTGLNAVLVNAQMSKAFSGSGMTFDGTRVVSADETASTLKTLNKGSVIIKFRQNTEKMTGSQVLLGGKNSAIDPPANSNSGKDCASFYMYNYNETRAFRFDMKHTRADSRATDLSDGEWHTIVFSDDVASANPVMRLTVDGVELSTFNGAANAGFFSMLNVLDQVSIGAHRNADGSVVNGFNGEIAYVAVTDEILTAQEAMDLTFIPRPGANISQMFNGDPDNTWVFAGGAAVEGGFSQVAGARNYIGQFEEYIRWTKSGNIAGRQRYTINLGKAGSSMAEIDESFASMIAPLDPKAVAVMVGEEDYLGGQEKLSSFQVHLKSILSKALALKDGKAYAVVQTPYAPADEAARQQAALYAQAVKDTVAQFSDKEQLNLVVVDHFATTNTEEFRANKLNKDGSLNAKGHLQIAKELSAATFGTDAGFPVNDNSFSFVPVPAPEIYLDAPPVVKPLAGSISVEIPDAEAGSIKEWRYTVAYKGQEVTNSTNSRTFVVDGLPDGERFTLTIQSADGTVQLPVMEGTTGSGGAAAVKQEEPLTAQQQALVDRLTQKKSATWLFLGDSITHGALHTHGYDGIVQTMEKYVRGEMGRTDDIFINTAVSGATTKMQLDNSQQRFDKYIDNADVVVVMFGTNDAANNAVSLDAYRQNLITMVDAIKAKGAIPVLRTPNPLQASTGNRGANLPKYAAVIREIAEQKGAILVDHFAEWTQALESRNYLWNVQAGFWNADNIHPNTIGHLNMSHALIRACGLWDSTSAICNLDYKMPSTSESSVLVPSLTKDENGVSVDVKTLDGAYTAGEFGSATLTAVQESTQNVYSITVGKGAETAKLLLPSGTYQVSVRAQLMAESKEVAFQPAIITIENSRADKKQLEAVYNEVKDKANEGYTEESWAAFVEARNAAKTAVEDANASQEQVDKAKAALQAAVDGLEKNESQEIVLKDEETQVEIRADKGVIEEGAQLVVSSVEDGESKDLIQSALEGIAEKIAAWDIRLVKNDAAIQPNGKITVKLPIPAGYDIDLLKAYWIDGDGGRKELTFTVKDGFAWVETDHFSLYALVQTNRNNSEPGSDSESPASSSSGSSGSERPASGGSGGSGSSSGKPNGGGSNTPATGDSATAPALVVLCATAACVLLWGRKKKVQM